MLTLTLTLTLTVPHPNRPQAEEGFDMIFIDADKGGYEAYYEACLSVPGLLAEGGVIVVDNVLFKGQAYRPRQAAAKDYASWNEGGTALADFNAKVAADPRTEQVTLLPGPNPNPSF